MYLNKKIGTLGEDLACKYLKKNDYIIKSRNFRSKQGEIDIIAFDKKKKELVFFEAKTRSNFHYGRPSDSVTKIKQEHILETAKYYIYKNFNNSSPYIRFDIIEIFIKDSSFKINHIKQFM